MSHRGYGLEHQIEEYFLLLTGHTNKDPIMDAEGRISRSFRVPNSGAMRSLKGDVRSCLGFVPKEFLIEAKHRREKSKDGSIFTPVYHLDMELVQKNVLEAEECGYMPVFAFAYKGSPRNRLHAIFRQADYDVLWNAAKGVMRKSLEPLEIELKENLKTYTIRKDLLDEKIGHPLTFQNDAEKFIIISWDIFGEILVALKTDYEKTKTNGSSKSEVLPLNNNKAVAS
jgi:hypothetical protein